VLDLAEVAVAETSPRQEGNQMHTILSQRAGRKTPPKKETTKAGSLDSAEQE